MSEHRATFTRNTRSSFSRRRRWVTGAVAALGAAGLIFGGLARAASPSELAASVQLDVWSDAQGAWLGDGGSVSGATASAYGDGHTVPFRLDLTAAGAGTFDLSLCREDTDGGVGGSVSLESYTTSGAPPIAPGAVVTDEAGGSEQPFTGAAADGSVHIDAVSDVGGPGACGPGWRETQVRLTVTGAPSGGPAVGAYVLWGGRLDTAADAAVDAGGQINGAGVSMRLGAWAEVGVGADGTVDVDADLDVEYNPDGDPEPLPAPDPGPVPLPDPTPTPPPLPDPVTVPDPGPLAPPDPGDVVAPGLDPPVAPGTHPGDRCASSRTTPRCGDDHEPAGDPNAETMGSTTGVDPANLGAGGGPDAGPAPLEHILGDVDQTGTAPADSPLPAGATLPKTGGGVSTAALRLLGLAAVGRTLLGRAGRH